MSGKSSLTPFPVFQLSGQKIDFDPFILQRDALEVRLRSALLLCVILIGVLYSVAAHAARTTYGPYLYYFISSAVFFRSG